MWETGCGSCCGLRTGHLVAQNVVRKPASGSCGLGTVNLRGLWPNRIWVGAKSVAQEYRVRVPGTVFHKSVLQRVSHKSVLQHCPTRVSHESVHKSVLQECLPQGCQKVSNNVRASVFKYVFAFGFVGSILFFQSHGSHAKTWFSIFLSIQRTDITEFGFTSRVTHGDTLSLDVDRPQLRCSVRPFVRTAEFCPPGTREWRAN